MFLIISNLFLSLLFFYSSDSLECTLLALVTHLVDHEPPKQLELIVVV